MQRRAAAIYCAFFLVIAAGSYGYVTAVADSQEPSVSLDAETYENASVLTVDGQPYSISGIKEEAAEEGGEPSMVGTITWTNDSARVTEPLENESEVTYQNETWTVHIENGSNVSEFTLQKTRNVSRLLTEDPAVDNTTGEIQGETVVTFADNTSYRALDDYLGAPETVSFAVDEVFPYAAEDEVVNTTVVSVTSGVATPAATLEWTTSQQNEIPLEEGANVTLGDETYLVHFPDTESVQLSQEFQAYQTDQNRTDYFQERKAGLWGVTIVSSIAALVLLSIAYLPVKD
jgi:hypothetical protein